ncbi:hypothetical protein GEOBRER4_n3246 [Citrifermentans bremense]|uniref:Peptidase M6-like domain-containing protein n=1 Tax=Citrifermentans bremense TaxID=60035 RepID=A0A6S6M3R8_9BACT|nr:M6 family metalloprotease domain-containing protein [Citrifermentans bremense]BCG48358.1 hypothetical protein GEOBRER4_n3246 [Citrifermentans bremense]
MPKRIFLTMLFVLLSFSASFAGPAAPDLLDIQQPDGVKFKGKIHGDEFQSWVEVDSGHTVVKDKATGRWEYAEKEPDGTLKASGVKVDPSGANAPSFLPKGVKPDRDVVREKQQTERQMKQFQDRFAPSFGSTLGDGSTSTGATSYATFAAGDWTPAPVSGNRQLLIILVNFANRTLVTTADSWYRTVFDTTPGVKSVANYYKENSFGKLNVVPAFSGGTHPGVVSVTVPDSHPNCGQNTTYSVETTIISHALAQAAAAVDLSGFDTVNGEVYLVYAGYEASGSAKTPSIWAHAWGGSVSGGGLTITRWALNGEMNNVDQQHPMGVIAHELGHALCGLPDLYDTTYTNAGLGYFSLMAGGSWGRTPTENGGTTPVALDAWSREYLGWTAPNTPTASGAVTLSAALASANNALKLINPSTTSNEYWLAENRHPVAGGWDEGITGLASGYGGGLLVTHIDITAGTQGANDINRYVSGQRQGVVPVQASTSVCNMLASGSANSCRGNYLTTYYSGNNTDFTSATAPSSKFYSGAVSNRGITSVSAKGATMTANVMVTLTTDTTKPLVTTFTVPATAAALTVPINSFVASDNIAVAGYLVTETSTAPLSSAAGWSGSIPTSYTFTTQGSKKLYAWAKDTTGNVSVAKTAAVVVDQTPPVVSAVAIPAYYNSLTVPVTLTVKDNVKVAGYLVTTSSSAPASSSTSWKTTAASTVTFSAGGANTCYAWAKDTVGNVSLSKSATVFIETVAPTVSSFTVDPLIAGLVIPIRALSASDTGGAGIGGYFITETATAPLASVAGWSLTPPVSYKTKVGGSKVLYAWAKDTAGNVSLARTASTVVDASKPVVTAFTVPAASIALTIPISAYTATDNMTVTGYRVTESSTAPLASATGWSATAPTSYTFATTGSKKLYAWAKDTAGNVSAAKVAAVAIDQTAPVVTVVKIPAFYNSLTVPVTLTVTDNVKAAAYMVTTGSTAPAVSSVNWKTTAAVTVTFSAPGSNTCYAWAKDTAGNVSLAKAATVVIETAAPTVATFTVDSLIAGLTIPVRALSGSDTGGSGVAGYRVTETATAPLATATGWSVTPTVSYKTASGGNKTLYAWVKDGAGNVSLARTTSTVVDATKPVVSAFTLPASNTGRTVPVLTRAASDNMAVAGYLLTESSKAPLATATGWSATFPTSYTFATTGSKRLYAWVKDTAGNVSAAKYAAVVVY